MEGTWWLISFVVFFWVAERNPEAEITNIQLLVILSFVMAIDRLIMITKNKEN